MHRQKMVFNACGVIATVALVLGGFMVAANGFEPPPWLLTAELALLSGLAAACCFTKLLSGVLPWLRLRPVQCTLFVVLGVLAVYVPPQFIASAVFLALGSRLVWQEACSVADGDKQPPSGGTTLARSSGNGGLPAKREPDAPLVAIAEGDAAPRTTRIGSLELVIDDQ
jgi:4-amino-4-deoxy-L-arabinose transferase-like glycosyltransferase